MKREVGDVLMVFLGHPEIERNRNHRHWRVQDVFRQRCCIHTIVAAAGLRNCFEHPTPTAIYSPKRDLAPIEVTSKQLWRPQVKGVRRPMHRELLLFGTQTSIIPKCKLCKFDLCQSRTETKFVRIFTLVHDYVMMNYEYDHFNRVSVFSICRSGRSNAPCGDQNCDGKRGNTFLPFKACKLMSDHKHITPKIALVIQQETQSTWQSTVYITCGPWAAQAVSNGVAEPVSEARPWLMAQCTHRNSKHGDVLKQSQTCKHLG